jgi:Flp pilus assembly protein TadD
LSELGPLDEEGMALGVDASARLARAAKRAFGRGDMHAAANLNQRAVALLPATDPTRLALLPELGEIQIELGNFAEARKVLTEAETLAVNAGNERIAASARLMRRRAKLFSAEPGDSTDKTLRMADEAIPLFEREAAYPELARAWRLIGLIHGIAARYGQSTDAVSQSMKYARLAGDTRLVARNATGLSSSTLLGPTPVPQAIELCEQMMADGLTDRQAESKILCTLAQLRAMRGDFDEARKLYRRGRSLLRELGKGLIAAGTGIDLLIVELLAGDLANAEREVMPDYKFLESAGETYRLSTIAALLSRVVRDQGRDQDAMVYSEVAERLTADDDVESLALWRSIRAPIVARTGRLAEAESLARSAVELSQQSDAPQMRAETLSELAAVLMLAGRREDARQAIGTAIKTFEAKGDTVSAARATAWAADCG